MSTVIRWDDHRLALWGHDQEVTGTSSVGPLLGPGIYGPGISVRRERGATWCAAYPESPTEHRRLAALLLAIADDLERHQTA